MKRRTVIQASTAAVATTVSLSLSGCLADDSTPSEAEGTDDEGTDEVTDEPETPRPITMNVTNNVEQLEIVDRTYSRDKDGVTVRLTVKNGGNQSTNIARYNYEVTPYDASGDEFGTMSTGYQVPRTETAAGETYELEHGVMVEPDPDEIAQLDITVDCEHSEAVYCQ